ncbi:MAG: hypothetical protein ACYDD5_00780 [Sulfuricurvum sp.]
MDFLKKWFSGPRFWHVLGGISLLFTLIGVIAGAPAAKDIIVTFIAFATAEILTAIDKKRE